MSDGGVNYSAARVPGAIDTLPGSIMELNTWILWAAVGLGAGAEPEGLPSVEGMLEPGRTARVMIPSV